MTRKIGIYAFFGLLLLAVAVQGAVAETVMVAASNSALSTKNSADYVCTGTNDNTVIQAALNDAAGGEVVLAAGSYKCSGLVRPPANTLLRGQGATATTLSFTGAGRMLIANPYVTITDLAISSSAHTYAWEGVVNVEASHAAMRNVIGTADATQCAVFYVVAGRSSTQLTDIEFTGCTAKDPKTFGWLFEAATNTESLKVISNVRMTDCAALNCGRYGRFNDWITGIDVSETNHLAYSTITRCRAEGCWESGFHMETPTTKTAVAFNDCTSRNNAQKTAVTGRASTFGAGFMVSGDSTLTNCVSENNFRGFQCSTGGRLVGCVDRDSWLGVQIDDISTGFRASGVTLIGEDYPIDAYTGSINSAILEGIQISNGGVKRSGAGIMISGGISGADHITVRDSSIADFSIGINNKAGQKVNVQNVLVSGASTSFINCNVISAPAPTPTPSTTTPKPTTIPTVLPVTTVATPTVQPLTPTPTPTLNSQVLLYNNGNTYTVKNNPIRATSVTFSKPARVMSITNYHWNNGAGAIPGTISLRHSDGTIYGPWQATGLTGNGVENGRWRVEPGTVIKAGTYQVIDSGKSTWSYNTKSGYAGFTQIYYSLFG